MTESQHTLVVGGTRGIGRAVVRAFAAAGGRVSVIGRREPSAEDRAQASVAYWRADVSNLDEVGPALQGARDRSGPLNHVVFLQRFRGEGDQWAGELATTLTATKQVIEGLDGAFAPTGDRAIVIVSSIIGQWVVENQAVGYHVAKAGLGALIRYYAVKLGPSGIRVNGVAPCTTLKEESKDFYLNNPDLLRVYEAMTPLRRMGTAEDVASVIEFLSSQKAAFMTGQILTVDGGTSLVWQESLARTLVPVAPYR